MNPRTRTALLSAVLVALLLVTWQRERVARWTAPLRGRHTVASRLRQLGAPARGRVQAHFTRAGVSYPPERMIWVGLKEERRLELYASHEGAWRHVHTYPVLGASGTLGPKLREGDRQVPEGFYRIAGLNPNSSYHLSLKVSYPNEEDWRHARAEGREEPGTDIFIHGKAVSIGCLAMGDPAIEELFVLAADMGRQHVRLLLAPLDLRARAVPETRYAKLPPWTRALHDRLRDALRALPAPDSGEGRPAR